MIKKTDKNVYYFNCNNLIEMKWIDMLDSDSNDDSFDQKSDKSDNDNEEESMPK